MPTSWSICSREANVERSSIRVRPSSSISRMLAVEPGSSSFGLPSASANASMNSSDAGGSTAVTSHRP